MKKRTEYQPESITIDLEEFAEKFTLKKNHLANASLSRGHAFETFIWRGCAFETFGEELQYIRSQPENTIWTIIENNNNRYIWSGLHYFDPVCYLQSEEPVPDTIEYTVPIL